MTENQDAPPASAAAAVLAMVGARLSGLPGRVKSRKWNPKRMEVTLRVSTSGVVDTIEHMFETGMMAPPAGAAAVALSMPDALESVPGDPGEVIRELQARIR